MHRVLAGVTASSRRDEQGSTSDCRRRRFEARTNFSSHGCPITIENLQGRLFWYAGTLSLARSETWARVPNLRSSRWFLCKNSF